MVLRSLHYLRPSSSILGFEAVTLVRGRTLWSVVVDRDIVIRWLNVMVFGSRLGSIGSSESPEPGACHLLLNQVALVGIMNLPSMQHMTVELLDQLILTSIVHIERSAFAAYAADVLLVSVELRQLLLS